MAFDPLATHSLPETHVNIGSHVSSGSGLRKCCYVYPQRDAQVNFEHAARQAYIGLSAAVIAAAHEEVDSTPMEGFDADALDKILKLRERGLRSVAILPLGYRQEEGDWLVKLPKVRRPADAFVTEVN